MGVFNILKIPEKGVHKQQLLANYYSVKKLWINEQIHKMKGCCNTNIKNSRQMASGIDR